jgi:hypothetical protein
LSHVGFETRHWRDSGRSIPTAGIIAVAALVVLACRLPAHAEPVRNLRPADAQADRVIDEHGQLSLRFLMRHPDTSYPLYDLGKARQVAFTPAQQSSPLAQRPYDLRHACLSTWLNGGVYPTQVAEWAGRSVDVLLRIHAKCVVGQDKLAKRRISEALLQD